MNVTWQELEDSLPYIRSLIQPMHTVMDVTISSALWFASRGIGKLHCQEEEGGVQENGKEEEKEILKASSQEGKDVGKICSQQRSGDDLVDEEEEEIEKKGEQVEEDLYSDMREITQTEKRKRRKMEKDRKRAVKKQKLNEKAARDAMATGIHNHRQPQGGQGRNSQGTHGGKGKGLRNWDEGRIYVCTTKVLLLGNGADELCGGYTRHRAVYNRSYREALHEAGLDVDIGGGRGKEEERKSQKGREEGGKDNLEEGESLVAEDRERKLEMCRKNAYSTLERELDVDLNRIWRRNLGRDDRIISSNSR